MIEIVGDVLHYHNIIGRFGVYIIDMIRGHKEFFWSEYVKVCDLEWRFGLAIDQKSYTDLNRMIS